MTSFLINPYRFAAAYDTDAQAYITAVEAADGQALETGVRDAINALVLALKAGNVWSDAVQLLSPCGPRTLTGALVPLKGTTPTNVGFASGDYARKTGLTGNGSSKYLNSNVLQNSLPLTTHSLAWYGSITENTGDKVLLGAYNGGADILSLDAWAAYLAGRVFRSRAVASGSVPVSTSTASVDCMIGARTASNNAVLYVNGTANTNTTSVTASFGAVSNYWFALNNQGTATGFSASRLAVGGIYSAGLNATQAAAFRSAAAAYVSALATAIP